MLRGALNGKEIQKWGDTCIRIADSLIMSQGGGIEGHVFIFFCENSKTATPLLNNHWLENVGSHQRKISHIQGHRRSPNKTVRGVNSCLESNSIPTRDAQRAQTKPCVHQDSKTPRETKPDLPLSVWVSPVEAQISSGLPRQQGLWLQQNWEVLHVA